MKKIILLTLTALMMAGCDEEMKKQINQQRWFNLKFSK